MAAGWPAHVEGKSEPVVAYEPVAASAGQSRFEALAQRGLASFVGRQAEFDALLRAWERAAAGRGQIVSVVGEAGLGKSRLLQEFKTEMAKREDPARPGAVPARRGSPAVVAPAPRHGRRG